jgi:hypothetical protein
LFFQFSSDGPILAADGLIDEPDATEKLWEVK